ncbi:MULTISPECIES: MMPL family transporter [Paenibacillus]|nr:MMPL family transporter [Paenibacillus peoriae]
MLRQELRGKIGDPMRNSHEQSTFLNSGIATEDDKIASTRIPVIVWVIIVTVVTIVWQTMSAPSLLLSIIFSLLMVLHIFLYWRVNQITRNSRMLYVVIQGVLIFGSAVLVPDGYPAVLIGLIPVLIGQTIAIFYETAKVVLVALILYLCFVLNIQIPFITMMGLAAAISVFVAVLIAVIFVPAVLAIAGERISPARENKWLRKWSGARKKHGSENRWGQVVTRKPWLTSILCIVILSVCTLPFLHMQLGLPDNGLKSTETTERRGYDLLA